MSILFTSVSFLGKFQEFDYGPMKNMEHYGQSEPPDYNVKNITAPISLQYGLGDLVVSPEVCMYVCMSFIVHKSFIRYGNGHITNNKKHNNIE
jgi:hypothetical protein